MLFKTHQNNIPQIKAHIRALGPTYFHGDGNMYVADEDNKLHSDNNVAFSNPKQEEAKYRLKFTSADQVPDTVDELNQLLLDAKDREHRAERASVAANGIKTFAVDGLAPAAQPAAPSAELEALKAQLAELQQLNAELQQAKAGHEPADKSRKETDAKAKPVKDAAAKAAGENA